MSDILLIAQILPRRHYMWWKEEFIPSRSFKCKAVKILGVYYILSVIKKNLHLLHESTCHAKSYQRSSTITYKFSTYPQGFLFNQSMQESSSTYFIRTFLSQYWTCLALCQWLPLLIMSVLKRTRDFLCLMLCKTGREVSGCYSLSLKLPWEKWRSIEI